MALIDVVAWWGAILSTAVLAWDVYKWYRSGSKLHVSFKPNLQALDPIMGELTGERLLVVTIANRGQSRTTVTALTFAHYATWFSRLRGRPSKGAIVPTPGGRSLPHPLDVGEEWSGYVIQSQLAELPANGYLYCAVYESTRDRPVRKRLPFPMATAN